jgi:hypothetical protein
MVAERVKECVALMMIGEGVLAMARPRGHARLWENGPRWWRQMIEPFARNPNLTRAAGAVEALAGFWLASRQMRAVEQGPPA